MYIANPLRLASSAALLLVGAFSGCASLNRQAEGPGGKDVRVAIEELVEGAWYGGIHGSESDHPFTYVYRSLEPGEIITLDLVRQKFTAFVDQQPDLVVKASLAEMFGQVKSDWHTRPEACDDPEEAAFNGYTEACAQLTAIDAALAAHLTDIRAYWFGTEGSPGSVEGVEIHIFILGRTPDGNLAGVHTIAVWT